MSSTCLQQGTQYWNYTCSYPYLKEQGFTHLVGSDSKSQSQSLINTPSFLQPSPENRRRYSFWITVFFSEKKDEGWCPKSVHPKSNILSSHHFRNYMTTTTFSEQNSNIKAFLSIFIVTSAARSIIYTMMIPSIDFTSASLPSCNFYSSCYSWCWQTLLHRNFLLMLCLAQQLYSTESLHFPGHPRSAVVLNTVIKETNHIITLV